MTSTPEPPAPTPSATRDNTPRAGCASKSQVRINAEQDPNYCPYCLRCCTMARMAKVAEMYWRCASCGAEHDERVPPASAPAATPGTEIGAAVCGVDCHPGDGLCNGYCMDARVKAPPTIRLASPLARAWKQVKQGAEGNGARLGAAECRAILTALTPPWDEEEQG